MLKPAIANVWIFTQCSTQCCHLLSNSFHMRPSRRSKYRWVHALKCVRWIKRKYLYHEKGTKSEPNSKSNSIEWDGSQFKNYSRQSTFRIEKIHYICLLHDWYSLKNDTTTQNYLYIYIHVVQNTDTHYTAHTIVKFCEKNRNRRMS